MTWQEYPSPRMSEPHRRHLLPQRGRPPGSSTRSCPLVWRRHSRPHIEVEVCPPRSCPGRRGHQSPPPCRRLSSPGSSRWPVWSGQWRGPDVTVGIINKFYFFTSTLESTRRTRSTRKMSFIVGRQERLNLSFVRRYLFQFNKLQKIIKSHDKYDLLRNYNIIYIINFFRK